MEILQTIWEQLRGNVWAIAGVSVAIAVLSTALVVVVLVQMPADYFSHRPPPPFLEGKPLWVRVLAMVVKNGLGWLLLVAGLVMSIPGVPGQGLLTIMVGLLLADFPGKRSLERRLVRVHAVHRVANSVRARFGKPELQGLEDPPPH